MNNFIKLNFQYLPAVLSGFLLTLSFPKSDISWLAWSALIPLMLFISRINQAGDNKKQSKAFKAGFITGLCHFLSLIYWIVPTISTYGGLPLYLSIPILFLLASYLALYPALFALGVSLFHNNAEKQLMPLFAACLWVSLEYIRSIFLTGFPWGLVGYSQYNNTTLIQIADITSVYGISFMVVLTNGVILKVLLNKWLLNKKLFNKDLILWILLLFIMFGAAISYGKFRIADIEKYYAESETVNITVVQGNIDQSLKWDVDYQQSTIEKYCRLSIDALQEFRQKIEYAEKFQQNRTTEEFKQNISKQKEVEYKKNINISANKSIEQKKEPDLIIFPETALPFYYSWNKPLSDMVDKCIKDIGTTFLIGSPAFETVEMYPKQASSDMDKNKKIYNIFNRAYMVNKLGIITGSYDKVHLVPFGEYVPLGKYMTFLGKIIAQAGDFSSGRHGSTPLAFNGSSAGILICFEIIFPYLSRDAVKNGAELLITMTNDAWFGYTSAPAQHFTMSIFRAIENRRAVARAANTGISGFILPTGKIFAKTALFEDAFLTKKIPCMKIKTVYSKYGDIFAFCCIFATLMQFILNIIKK